MDCKSFVEEQIAQIKQTVGDAIAINADATQEETLDESHSAYHHFMPLSRPPTWDTQSRRDSRIQQALRPHKTLPAPPYPNRSHATIPQKLAPVTFSDKILANPGQKRAADNQLTPTFGQTTTRNAQKCATFYAYPPTPSPPNWPVFEPPFPTQFKPSPDPNFSKSFRHL